MTILDKRWIDENGIILIRFKKPDGGWHRTSIEPGIDAAAQMAAVNAHLESMGHEKVSNDDVQVIKDAVEIEHKPEVVTAYRARIAAQREQR